MRIQVVRVGLAPALIVGVLFMLNKTWTKSEPQASSLREFARTKVRGSAGADSSGIISLEDSLSRLRERFNADKAKPRFIAILSPT